MCVWDRVRIVDVIDLFCASIFEVVAGEWSWALIFCIWQCDMPRWLFVGWVGVGTWLIYCSCSQWIAVPRHGNQLDQVLPATCVRLLDSSQCFMPRMLLRNISSDAPLNVELFVTNLIFMVWDRVGVVVVGKCKVAFDYSTFDRGFRTYSSNALIIHRIYFGAVVHNTVFPSHCSGRRRASQGHLQDFFLFLTHGIELAQFEVAREWLLQREWTHRLLLTSGGLNLAGSFSCRCFLKIIANLRFHSLEMWMSLKGTYF